MRALLNLGHTFGHALELIAGYNGDLLHGEAVSVGMVMATQASCDLGMCTQDDVARVVSILRALKLPVYPKDIPLRIDPDVMYDAMLGDKKATKDGIGFILLDGLGTAVVRSDLSRAFVLNVLKQFS